MTSATERAYFEWFAQHIFSGEGEIVDLGCWLGSTTIPLAIGLAKNPDPKAVERKIHAYDDFVWKSYMTGRPPFDKLRAGETFIEEFKRLIAPWHNRIQVYPEDLGQAEWKGGKIEFLLIDAMKSWELTNSIVKRFYPSLVPGTSFILHQDFGHWFTSWIHLLQYRLRQYFEPVYHIPRSGSVVFKLVKAIPNGLLREKYSFASFTRQEIDGAFEYSLELVSEDRRRRASIAAAKVMVFLHLGDLAEATRELEAFRSRGFQCSSDLGLVEQRLRRMSLRVSS